MSLIFSSYFYQILVLILHMQFLYKCKGSSGSLPIHSQEVPDLVSPK